jgi:dihydrolipoamide dehydrogenase
MQANCDKLEVEKTGVELTDQGMIKADECLRTTCEGVWALGDCVGNFMFRHSANFEAEYLLRSAALPKDTSKQPPLDYAVPNATCLPRHLAVLTAPSSSSTANAARSLLVSTNERSGQD